MTHVLPVFDLIVSLKWTSCGRGVSLGRAVVVGFGVSLARGVSVGSRVSVDLGVMVTVGVPVGLSPLSGVSIMARTGSTPMMAKDAMTKAITKNRRTSIFFIPLLLSVYRLIKRVYF